VVRVVRGREPGQHLRRIAGDFGISESCLTNWLKVADVEDGAKPGVSRVEAVETRELRKRVRLLEQENEVLCRAAAYLSQANLPGKRARASFAGACGVGLLALLTYLAVEILVPLQVAELNGIGVFATGLVLLPGALITVAISRAAGHWSDRRGDRRVAVVGAAVMAVAAGGLSTVAGSGPVLVGAGMLVLGLGFALVVVSAVNAAARALPQPGWGSAWASTRAPST